MFDIISIGGASLDFFVETDNESIIEIKKPNKTKEYFCFSYGDKIEIEQSTFSIGGGAVNTSVCFSLLGLNTAVIAKTGAGHISDYLLSKLKKYNVDTSLIVRNPAERTGFSIIMTSFEGDRTVLTQRGANSTLKASDIDWEKLSQTKAIYCSSLSNESEKLMGDISCFCKQNNIKLAWNPGNTTLKKGIDAKKEILQNVNILVLNKEEAKTFLKNSDLPTKKMLEQFKNYVKDVVIITNGKNGMNAFDGKNFYFAEPYPANVVSSLGAGDAFSSTFVATYFRTGDIKQAIAFANINSASVVQEWGAQNGLKTYNELSQIVEKANIEIVVSKI